MDLGFGVWGEMERGTPLRPCPSHWPMRFATGRDISGPERNLRFEREFGKIIGRLDLLAEVVTEKYRRAVISYVQNFVGGTFLQFLPVR